MNALKFIRKFARYDDSECRKYSGRGMHGRYCPGIISSPSFALAMRMALYAMECGIEDPQELLAELMHPASDSMGFDTIWYWPNIIWEKEDDDIDRDSEEEE